MRRRSGLLLCALAVWLTPASAYAGTFPIVGRGVRLDVYTWDGKACVVTPERPDKSACVASDPTSAPAPMGHVDVVSSAVIHSAGWDMKELTTGDDVSTFEGTDPEDVIALAKQAVRASLPSGAHFVSDGLDANTQVQRANGGAPFVRVTPTIETTSPAGAHETLATVVYVVCSGRGTYEIAFMSDAAHAADVAKVADNALASLVATPPLRANVFDVLFGRIGRLIACALVLAVAVSLVMWLRTRRRRPSS